MMKSTKGNLTPLSADDREQFILDNHTEEDGEAYRIMLDGKPVGGVVLKINTETKHNELELLFVSPDAHSKGIGYSAWKAVEALHPETEGWETYTPYFEKRNIHVYIEIEDGTGSRRPLLEMWERGPTYFYGN